MLRPAHPADYPAIARIHNTLWPEHFRSLEDFAHLDRHNHVRRFLLELDGPVAVAGLRDRGAFYEFEVGVLPEFEGRGLGRELYARLLRELEALPPKRTLAFVKESHPYALAFAARRGWRESLRGYHQHLDLAAFDPAPFEGLRRRLEAEGYAFHSYAVLPDPERLYPLLRQTYLDVPRSGEAEPLSLEEFRRRFVLHPAFHPQTSFVAVREGEWAGLSLVRRRGESGLHSAMTGVLPAHRGRGLATALKVCSILEARRLGFAELHTNNAAGNAPMLAVNARLGFVREPAQIELELTKESLWT